MGRGDLTRYRRLLEGKREELLRRVHAATRPLEGVAGEPDFTDRASSTASQETLLALSSGERAILKLVEEALGRIEAGTYGVCVACERPIQPARLEAVPWARHCIDCQELQDRGLL